MRAHSSPEDIGQTSPVSTPLIGGESEFESGFRARALYGPCLLLGILIGEALWIGLIVFALVRLAGQF
jgi:hypothetical protein